MIVAIVILALIVLAIFGVGFIVNSAAHANQAQAVIETARIGQVQAVNNLMGMTVMAVVALALVAVIVMIFVLALRRPAQGRPAPYLPPVERETSARMPPARRRAKALPPPDDEWQAWLSWPAMHEEER